MPRVSIAERRRRGSLGRGFSPCGGRVHPVVFVGDQLNRRQQRVVAVVGLIASRQYGGLRLHERRLRFRSGIFQLLPERHLSIDAKFGGSPVSLKPSTPWHFSLAAPSAMPRTV